MNRTEIILFFQKRIQEFKAQEIHFRKLDQRLSFFRITWFILILIGVVILANNRAFYEMAGLGVLGLSVFVFSIKHHQTIKFKFRQFQILRQINEQEIKRLEGDFSTFQSDGSIFINAEHPYTSDLDIFGKNSLFQWLCRSSTISGQEKLAEFLKQPASKITILLRQEAVIELAQNTDFRHQFEAYGKHFQNLEKVQKYTNPFISKDLIFKDIKLIILSFLLPISLVLSLIGLFFGFSIIIPVVVFIINSMILGKYFQKITDITQKTIRYLTEIQAFVFLAEMIEKTDFKSSHLIQLRKSLLEENTSKRNSASLVIKELYRTIENLSFRENPYFYLFFNIPFLWELHQMRRFEQLKVKYEDQFPKWFEVIAEIDALNSFGGIAFAQEEFHFPEITEIPYYFEAKNLAHPLIFPLKQRVANDFKMTHKRVCNLITGSNMSGKSTFLRTVGLNMVLASAGAPVCADKLQVTPFQLFTSMRTQDSLSESTSSFYAELKRIRQLLELVESGEIVCYFLDEILKGTNSDDRHRGAKALIKQLQNHGVSGFISTHDLQLGKQANSMPHMVRNFSFNSQINAEELQFDYKISEGICRSFNASILMQKIGIEIDNL